MNLSLLLLSKASHWYFPSIMSRPVQAQIEISFTKRICSLCQAMIPLMLVWCHAMTQPLVGREKKPIKIKKFGRIPPLLNCNHTVDVSRLSCGNVPSVPRTFCPVYMELHTNEVGISRLSRDLTPKPPPGHFQGIRTT